MAKTKKRGATRTIWGSPLSHFLPKKARGHEARSTSTSRKTVHSTNTMPPLKVGDSVRERAKPGRIGVVKRATKGDNNKKHKWDVEFEDGSTEMKSSQALLKITKLTGKQMADKIAEIVGKPVVTERKSTNGTKNLESEEAEAVKKKKPSRMTTTLEAETDEDFTVIPTLDGGVMEVQDINNLESDEEYRLKEMYYKVKKAQLIKEKWSVTVKADRLKMGVGSTVRFRKESDSRIGTIIAKADDNVKWIVKFDDDDFPETLAYQSLQLVDDLAEETGEYVWRILDESVPTKDDPKPAEYKDVGVTDFHFGMMADDETSKENSDYQLPYLKLLIHLWPGDWWKQLQQMNEYIQSQNEEHGRHKGYKKCKSVTAKEWWKFIGILIVAAAEGKGGHALFERAEGRKARTATETTNYGKDGRNIMSKNRFDAIRKYFPYAFQDLEAMRNGDPWHMVSKLVEDFNTNRAEKIAASVYKVVDELISAWRPQSTPKGGLPHLSFIMRKPEPLGTEFKSLVCSITGKITIVCVVSFLPFQKLNHGINFICRNHACIRNSTWQRPYDEARLF